MPASRRPTLRNTPVKAKRPATRKAPVRAKRPVAAVNGAKAARYAGVGSDAVQRATGRAWAEWLAVLDRAGAKAMVHKDIALLLSRKFEVADWWCQMVTVGYEQARGLRVRHQQADGFAANVSRTFSADLENLCDAWEDPRARARWLRAANVEVKRATEGKSMRLAWSPGDSSVNVGFAAKGDSKSQVQVAHGKLKSAAAVARQKAYWAEALDRLKSYLEAKR